MEGGGFSHRTQPRVAGQVGRSDFSRNRHSRRRWRPWSVLFCSALVLIPTGSGFVVQTRPGVRGHAFASKSKGGCRADHVPIGLVPLGVVTVREEGPEDEHGGLKLKTRSPRGFGVGTKTAKRERSSSVSRAQSGGGREAISTKEKAPQAAAQAPLHPGLKGVPARELRHMHGQPSSVDLRNAIEQGGQDLRPGMFVYSGREDGTLVMGVLHEVRREKNNEEDLGFFALVRHISGEGRGEAGVLEWVPLGRVFPVGGMNGPADSGLHKLVQGRDRFEQQVKVRGDEDAIASLGSIIRSLQEQRSNKPSLLKMLCSEEPILEAILEYLDMARLRMMQEPLSPHVLVFSAASVAEAREAFQRSNVIGMEKLARFCEAFAHVTFPDQRFARQSVVIAQTEYMGKTETFTLTETLDEDELLSGMNGQSLGSRALARMKVLPTMAALRGANATDSLFSSGGAEVSGAIPEAYRLGDSEALDKIEKRECEEREMGREGWQSPREVTGYLGYEALTSRDIGIGGVYRFFGVQKSPAEVWDNVADRICQVDGYLDEVSNRGRSSAEYVDDVLTVKIIVDGEDEARALLGRLQDVRFDAKLLRSVEVPFYPEGHRACTERLKVLAVNDHLTPQDGKVGGWRAMRVLVRWYGIDLNLLIEPLEVFHREQERVTPESFGWHKRKRSDVRGEIASRWPAYKVTRELLEWMFVSKGNNGFVGEVPLSDERVRVRFVPMD
uniref:Uncharacterized protein n=2 Tax=Hemiselmis andersenii TaxID=464988 RepID=A0A6U5A752_HEMAN